MCSVCDLAAGGSPNAFSLLHALTNRSDGLESPSLQLGDGSGIGETVAVDPELSLNQMVLDAVGVCWTVVSVFFVAVVLL